MASGRARFRLPGGLTMEVRYGRIKCASDIAGLARRLHEQSRGDGRESGPARRLIAAMTALVRAGGSG